MKRMNVLMVGVDKMRIGGMWSVAETYINDKCYNSNVYLTYVSTSTEGKAIKKVLKMISGYIQILFYLIFKPIDIVHIHMAERGSVYRKGIVVFLSKKFGKKVIVQMHAGPIMSWYETLDAKKKGQVQKIFNSCDKMLVLGEYWKKQLAKIVDNEKLIVLYNGADCPEKNRYNVNGKYIIFLGMITRKKGAFDLVDAIDKIHNVLSEDIKVLLCGFDKNDEVKSYVKSKGLQERIFFTGWVNSKQRDIYFSDTRICVLPSYFEGLSMTVIEAMCYGIPVVTTNISTMPELLGKKIDLITPGDIDKLANQIFILAENEDMCKEQSEILFKRAKEFFAREVNINNTLEIYKNCMSSKE